jgi:uncharacterized protein YndB with AHSA1/START domain
VRVSSRSHDINADPMTVWMVLTDLARYPEWHPRITYAAGDVTPGGRLTMRSRTLQGRSVTARPKVITAEPGSELRMGGGSPWLMSLETCWHLSPSNGGTHAVYTETLVGLVSWLLWPVWWFVIFVGKAVAGRTIDELDQALKVRAEAIYQKGR